MRSRAGLPSRGVRRSEPLAPQRERARSLVRGSYLAPRRRLHDGGAMIDRLILSARTRSGIVPNLDSPSIAFEFSVAFEINLRVCVLRHRKASLVIYEGNARKRDVRGVRSGDRNSSRGGNCRACLSDARRPGLSRIVNTDRRPIHDDRKKRGPDERDQCEFQFPSSLASFRRSWRSRRFLRTLSWRLCDWHPSCPPSRQCLSEES